MNRILTIFAAIVLSAMLTACNQAPAPTANTSGNHDADVQALRDTEAKWNQDFAAKDATKLANYYADDAVLLVPGSTPAAGKAAIQKVTESLVADPALSLHFKASKVEVASSGDLGYTQGSYLMTMTDPATKKPMNDHGSYVTTYRKQPDGSWKAVADIVTSEVPMAPVAPTKMKH